MLETRSIIEWSIGKGLQVVDICETYITYTQTATLNSKYSSAATFGCMRYDIHRENIQCGKS
jgi:hypothetical protein